METKNHQHIQSSIDKGLFSVSPPESGRKTYLSTKVFSPTSCLFFVLISRPSFCFKCEMTTEKPYGKMKKEPEENIIARAGKNVRDRRMTKGKHPNEALRYHRLLRGWSQTKVADDIGASNEMISNWERGQKKTSSFYQEKLCALFGMNAAELGFLGSASDDSSLKVPPALSLLARESIGIDTPTGLDLLTASDALLKTQSQEPQSVLAGLFNSKKELLGTPFLEFQQELSTRGNSLKTPQRNNEAYRLSRRQVLLSIVALSMPLLITSQQSLFFDIEELLSSLKMSIDACWQLSNEFDITAVYSAVSSYLPSLAAIVKQSPSHRREAAHLAAQASLLKAIIGRHITTLQSAEVACKDAILYSEIAEEPVLQLATLRHLAMIYFYAKCHKEELALYQRMKPFLSLETIPPLMRSFIYAGWAGTQALNDLRQEAQSSLALAHEMFSLQPTTEACPVYIDYNYSQLFLSEGLTYYDLGSYQEALDAFLQVDGLSPKIPVAERGRLEFLNCQALAVLRLPNRDREMQQCIDYWTAGIQGAIRLKSKQRYDEACRTYEFMQFVWPHEKKIKALRELMVQ